MRCGMRGRNKGGHSKANACNAQGARCGGGAGSFTCRCRKGQGFAGVQFRRAFDGIYAGKNELDPMPLIECAKAAGKRIAFPLCIENGGLRLFVPNNGADSFVSGSYGILEPKPEDSTEVFAEDIDLIIVPAVAFTKECGRLGQGGGYYDRLLKKTGAFTVGVGYDFQLCESLPVEEHDMPLDCVALPGALFKKG